MSPADSSPAPVEPDTKDWTWILDRPCPECGFDAAAVDRDRLGTEIRDNAERWQQALAAPGADQRPEPRVWSPAEYGCHVRDVHQIFRERVALMLAAEPGEPARFTNWNQDETAVAERYHEQQPDRVAAELADAAEQVAAAYDGVAQGDPAAWERRGLRSDGSEFTVDSLGRYHLHDVVHHLWDVRWVHGADRGGA